MPRSTARRFVSHYAENGASMRPRRNAAEYHAAKEYHIGVYASFNEAAA